MVRLNRTSWMVVWGALSLGCTSVEVPVAHIEGAGPATCALRTDGAVSCWGDTFGDVPTNVPGLQGASALSMGTFAVCAIRQDRSVTCLRAMGGASMGTPAAVGIDAASQISVGAGHACALRPNGHVACWGQNMFGQLGDGSFADSDVPVEVAGLSGVVEVSAGEFSSCARLSDGSARCWGRGLAGQLGDGDGDHVPCVEGEACAPTPVTVLGVDGARDIAAGLNGAVALAGDGAVMSWGWTRGDGGEDSADTPSPVEVEGVYGAARVYAGYERKCAVLGGGDLVCWGVGVSADVSIPAQDMPLASRVDGLSDVVEVTGGWYHLCALLRSGEVQCWGNNDWSQLGNGSGEGQSAPTLVEGL